jgi:hypothetical protein
MQQEELVDISKEMQRIRCAIQESDIKTVQTHLNKHNSTTENPLLQEDRRIQYAHTFIQEKPALLQLAEDTLSIRKKEYKNSNHIGWFSLRSGVYSFIVLKLLADTAKAINGYYAENPLMLCTDIIADSGLLISGGYNFYRFMGPDNISNKDGNAEKIKKMLRNATYTINNSSPNTNMVNVEIE